MRMIIIAVVALLVLGGGGAGAYFYFMKPAEASAGAVAAGEVGKEHEEAKKGGKEAKEEGPPHEFVELDPLLLPIMDNNGVNQVISLVVALEVEDAKTAEEVTKMTPKLKDAFIQEMYGRLNQYAALKGGAVQVSDIKKHLNEISAKVMGEGVVKDVLLQVVQQRPI